MLIRNQSGAPIELPGLEIVDAGVATGRAFHRVFRPASDIVAQ